MAATEPIARLGRLRRLARAARRAARRLGRMLQGLFGGLLAGHAASAATLPEERSELLYHRYDGGGLEAGGPALLVRKTMADRVSLFGSYYVDAISNASIDVVTTASPYKETRRAYDLGGDWLVRDTLISASAYISSEPDYDVRALSVDVAHEVFGHMTTLAFGFTRASDDVRKAGEPTFEQAATHWQYRAGLTQVLSPRWIASLHAEGVHDAGFLGSPYRVARVFGATVPESVPGTRSSRAVKLRSVNELGEGGARTALRAEYRYYWDNWDIRAHTFELGASRYLFGDQRGRWLLDAWLRHYTQSKALFYSDDAQAAATYVSRNRQFSTFTSGSVGARLSWSPPGIAAQWDTRLSLAYEHKQFDYADFTDLRTGAPYSHNAGLLQLVLSARF